MATPGEIWVEAIGITAACLTTLSFLPQALRIWRLGSARDVSLTMYLMMFAGQIMWLTYGVVIGSASLIFSNISALVLVGSVLLLKLRDVGGLKISPPPVPPAAE
jgi:MtN3 and saliva related transmembrane protein